MNYSEAVALALEGKEQGFQFLYEESYKSKYYLALQYMKTKEAAEDVLQDAYIKAFNNLGKLQEPAAFEKWFGVIVANTAKNALAKKNPVLFTDVAVDDEGEEFTYDVEDENPENQPELAYTREETKELVHELMESLSEEQRMCILMFHIEGASISEIAEAMNCSANTVKSRLNYGRKNIKVKAEELQKKGYKLYSIAPVLLLVYLLRSDAETVSASTGVTAAGRVLEEKILDNLRKQQIVSRQQQAEHYAEKVKSESESAGKTSRTTSKSVGRQAGKTAAKATKTGFLHTAAGKAVAAIIAVGVVGGAFYGGMQWNSHNSSKSEATEAQQQPEATEALKVTAEPTATPESTATPELTATSEPTPTPVTKEYSSDYSEWLEGGLTEEELEYVLAYLPQNMEEGSLTEDMLTQTVNALCQGTGKNGEIYITNQGWDDQSRGIYSTAEINRFISCFTDYQYPGDTVALYIATLNREESADIYTSLAATTMLEKENDINIYYRHREINYDESEAVSETYKVAVMRPTESGRYRIVKIRDASEEESPENINTTIDKVLGNDHPEPAPGSEAESAEPASKNTTAGSTATGGIRSLYERVLTDVQNGQYSFPQNRNSSKYEYFVADINGDGIPELAVGPTLEDTAFIQHDMKIFTCTQGDGGYQLTEVPGDQLIDNIYIAADGNGLYEMMVSRGNGNCEVHRITIGSGSLDMGGAEQTFILNDASFAEFTSTNSFPEWKSVSDISGLDGLQ